MLVFTTHGRQPIQWMLDGSYGYGLSRDEQRLLIEGYAASGFGFVSPSNQAFGISLSSLAFACTQVQLSSSLQIVGLQEAGWAGHQDVITCLRLRAPYPRVEHR